MLKEKLNIRSYDEISEKWDEIRSNQEINQCVVAFASFLKKNSYILDIGCGTGSPIDTYLTSNNFKVLGIDSSKEMIKIAKSKNITNAKFINIDFFSFKSKRKFDAIIAFDSLWHINYSKQEKIYKKLANLIKPNGYLMFTCGKNDDERYGTMLNKKFYYASLYKDEVVNLLSNNGFFIVCSFVDYVEKTTGSRDLLIVARKKDQ